jgi:hypothetical protein
MEVKTADTSNKAGWTEEQWADWANRRTHKALSQIERGATALTSGLVKEVENDRQGRVAIEPGHIRNLYGVVIVDHPALDTCVLLLACLPPQIGLGIDRVFMFENIDVFQ